MVIVAELNIALPPWVVPFVEYLLRKTLLLSFLLFVMDAEFYQNWIMLRLEKIMHYGSYNCINQTLVLTFFSD